jgi:hypothetical protein
MSRCRTRSLNSAATLIVAFAVGVFPAAAQQPKGTSPTKAWTVGRTPDGQPDLQGMWTNYDQTPFEQLRPEEIERRGPAVSTQDWLIQDSPTSPRRPSMVVDPPSGRIPIKPEAIARRDAAFAQESDSLERYGPWERCITRGVPGSMWPGAYNNGHQIIQTKGYVVLHSEMIHEARIIPLDGRPTLGSAAKSWDGESRGHWQGDTLVIETSNFNGKGWLATNAASGRLRGIELSEKAHVVERLNRVSENTIRYEATIEDPNVYTRPWTLSFPLNKDEPYRIFEYACHEGNYALGNMLRLGAQR